MLRVETALLLHTTATGRHHDWLVALPGYRSMNSSGLWTARVEPASRCWRGLGCFELTLLEAHRPVYLTYQGPVSGGRGRVRRVDRGTVGVRLGRAGRAVWDVRLRDFQGAIEVSRVSGDRWRARVLS